MTLYSLKEIAMLVLLRGPLGVVELSGDFEPAYMLTLWYVGMYDKHDALALCVLYTLFLISEAQHWSIRGFNVTPWW